MKRKFATVSFALILMFALSFALIACNGDEGGTHTHSMSYVEAKAATCTEDGHSAYWTCTECKKMFSDEARTTEITDPSEITVYASGHNYVNGVCDRCGAEDYEKLIGYMTRQEYEDAFALENFANFTVTYQEEEGIPELIYRFAEQGDLSIAYMVECQRYGSDVYVLQRKGETTATEYTYDKENSAWVAAESEDTVADIKKGLVSETAANGYLSAVYSNGVYTIPDAYWFSFNPSTKYDVEITFDGGKIKTYETVIGNNSLPFIFDNYDTTEIALPDFDKKETLGFEYYENNPGELTADFSSRFPATNIYVPATHNGLPLSNVIISNPSTATSITVDSESVLKEFVVYGNEALQNVDLPAIDNLTRVYITNDSNNTSFTVNFSGTKAQWNAIPEVVIDDNVNVVFKTHIAGDWTVTEEASCTEDGYRVKYCSDCGIIMEEESIPASGHNPAATLSYDEDYHWYVCENGCGERLEYAKHVYGGMECTQCDYALQASDGFFMWRYDYGAGQQDYWTIYKYSGSATEVVVPSGYRDGYPIRRIDPGVFQNNTNIVSVTLPDGMSMVDEYAFKGCTSLTSIRILGETTLSKEAFAGCTSLTELEFDNVTIGTGAFKNCTGLQKVVVNNGYIGADAFYQCTSLKEVVYNGSVNYNAGIGESAFYGCSSLTDIKLSNVTSIGQYAFSGCVNLETLILPVTVTEINSKIIMNCPKITEIYYEGTIEQWNSITINRDPYSDEIDNVTICYYSESDPYADGTAVDGKTYWHYQEGLPVVWEAPAEL